MRALDVEYMWDLVPVLLGYVPLTLFMALIGMFFALILASLMAVERVFRVPVLDIFVRLFISFFRGTRCWCNYSCSTTACRRFWHF
jgi:putative amino-acid transport system permease protein